MDWIQPLVVQRIVADTRPKPLEGGFGFGIARRDEARYLMPSSCRREMSTLQKLTRKLALLFIIMMFMAEEYSSAPKRKEEG